MARKPAPRWVSLIVIPNKPPLRSRDLGEPRDGRVFCDQQTRGWLASLFQTDPVPGAVDGHFSAAYPNSHVQRLHAASDRLLLYADAGVWVARNFPNPPGESRVGFLLPECLPEQEPMTQGSQK